MTNALRYCKGTRDDGENSEQCVCYAVCTSCVVIGQNNAVNSQDLSNPHKRTGLKATTATFALKQCGSHVCDKVAELEGNSNDKFDALC